MREQNKNEKTGTEVAPDRIVVTRCVILHHRGHAAHATMPPPIAAISLGEGPADLDEAMTSSIRRIMTAASAALETA